MNTQIQELQDAMPPNILGVFWITKENIMSRPSPFEALDYFLDGLLSSFYLKQNELAQINNRLKTNKNFFVSNHFGKQFFVGHLDISDQNQDITEELTNLMDLVRKLKREEKNNTIVILNNSSKHLQFLTKKWPSFKFKFHKFGSNN